MRIPKRLLSILFCLAFKFVNGQFTDTLFVSGLPDASRKNATKIITRKWQILRYDYGCVVTNELIDSIHAKNDRTHKRLIPKYGTGWLERYYDEIEAEYQIEIIINDLVNQQSYIKACEIIQADPRAGFEMYPLANGSDYIVLVDNWKPEEGWKKYHVYKLRVNHKQKKVTILKKYARPK